MTAPESGELISQHEGELRCSEGSGMLIGTLYGDGSNASSTDNGRSDTRATYHQAMGRGELHSQYERELRRPEGSGMLIGDPLL